MEKVKLRRHNVLLRCRVYKLAVRRVDDRSDQDCALPPTLGYVCSVPTTRLEIFEIPSSTRAPMSQSGVSALQRLNLDLVDSLLPSL